MNSTASRNGWFNAASATSRSAGLALKAIPRPATESMSMSLAPSPTAIVCSIGTPTWSANARNARALPGRSMISPITRPVSRPSTTSRVLARTKSSSRSCARPSIT
ncbi:Uncharacterised protein [Mycobacteroides abscessus subsp. abscessus]|nr:Uncharacterised protein [Mycobacteroides abscessus subsp. abscessus]